MNDCIFCKIVAKTIPSHTVYEDEQFLAFLDIRPLSAGHTQVIPKEHHRFVWDVPNVGAYFEIARKIAQAQQKAFDTEFIQSKIVGEEIVHAHIWVFPSPETATGDARDFLGNAETIRAELQ